VRDLEREVSEMGGVWEEVISPWDEDDMSKSIEGFWGSKEGRK
jgi:hypothetical protein